MTKRVVNNTKSNEPPRNRGRHHRQKNRKYDRDRSRRSKCASSSLTSSLSTEYENSMSFSSSESLNSSSSEFSPRQSTLNLQQLVRSKNSRNRDGLDGFNSKQTRNSKC